MNCATFPIFFVMFQCYLLDLILEFSLFLILLSSITISSKVSAPKQSLNNESDISCPTPKPTVSH